ncbi:hypothetical protein EDB84DRAFT_1601041 [Lactarius hengduanensis]|nr:hypothetical protein EDB84DRAFT_1601041 [Lactarius hengduanensis]
MPQLRASCHNQPPPNMEIYTSTLPSWRAAVRRQCLAVVERESEIIAHWQSRVRTPWLDTYFLHTSMLGTHTFFLVLCYALAFGVYMSSYLKDLVCSPRPYAPPVVRLTVGNHHLEYGLPSTHSTNSTSMALFLGAHVYDLHRLGTLSTTAFATWVVVLFIYVFSIVVGRLYTGMHGLHGFWLLQHLVMPEVEKWVQSSDWSAAPLVVTVVCLLLVNQHPSPVDDCPCFEDAIAFASVILGIITSFWCSKRVPALNTDLFTSVTPAPRSTLPPQVTTWVLFAFLKLVTGVLIIFSWRILAKPSVQSLLPPLFRWLAWASPVRLPHRRHYTPATEYVHGPPHTLRAVPTGGVGEALARLSDEGPRLDPCRRRPVTFEEASEGGTGEDGEVKHYDADVLTKVVVYVGIGAIATVMVPALFEALGWGV